MRRRLLILSAAAVLALLAVGLFLLLRQSVIAGIVRASAEARLSAALGQPVTIGEIGFSLSPQPAFVGSDIRLGEADATRAAPALRLDRIRVVPRLRSFFSHVVRIEEIRLDGFTVSILRDRAGRWHAPAAFPSPSQDARSGIAIERVRIGGGTLRIFDATGDGEPRERSSIDEIRAGMLIDAAGLRLAPLTGRVGAAIIDGEAAADARSVRLAFNAPAINDADLPRLLGLLGASRPAVLRVDEQASASVTVTINRAASRLSGTGKVHIPVLTVEPLRLQHVDAPFTIAGSRLTFAPTTFEVNGGTHRGRVTLALDSEPPRWTSESRLEGIDVGALLDALAGRDAKIDGRAEIDGVLQGRVEKDFIMGVGGRARLAMASGVIHDFPLIATINRTLRLASAESNDTRFERLSATLAMAHASAATEDLVIDSGHLRVEAAGRIGFDGALDLRGRVLVSQDWVSGAVERVRELARAKNSRGEIEIPLTIAGTLDAPRFGLDLETAIRQGVRDELMRRLRGFIRRD